MRETKIGLTEEEYNLLEDILGHTNYSSEEAEVFLSLCKKLRKLRPNLSEDNVESRLRLKKPNLSKDGDINGVDKSC